MEDLLGNTWFYGGGGVVERGSAVANIVLRGDYRKLIAN